jgi:2-polyprenyl-3-methyl-5-hydroxy-6-metoxy-1,4-benzoquinol methylase
VSDGIRTDAERVPLCPICASAGPVALEGCRDRLFERAGTWSYRRCIECSSLWIDPRPAAHVIPSLYPEAYVTHASSAAAQAAATAPERWKLALKAGALSGAFGYDDRTGPAVGRALGALAARSLPAFARRIGYAVRFVSSRPAGTLLDVGCGNGAFLAYMARLGWSVEGVEPDSRSADIAAERGIRVMRCGVEEAPLEAGRYNAVTLMHVIEHLPSPRAALARIARSLKPGGRLVSFSPNPCGALARRFGECWYALEAPRHLVLPSAEAYRRMFTELGFRVKTWTTMREAAYVCRESLSIRKTGYVGACGSRLLPKILVAAGRITAPLQGGDEIVCVADKP